MILRACPQFWHAHWLKHCIVQKFGVHEAWSIPQTLGNETKGSVGLGCGVLSAVRVLLRPRRDSKEHGSCWSNLLTDLDDADLLPKAYHLYWPCNKSPQWDCSHVTSYVQIWCAWSQIWCAWSLKHCIVHILCWLQAAEWWTDDSPPLPLTSRKL